MCRHLERGVNLSIPNELSIHLESFYDEFTIMKETQDANLLSQESKLTRVN